MDRTTTAITRREFLGATAGSAAGIAADQVKRRDKAASQSQSHLNFLVVCTDQQHWQAAGYIDPFFDTPSLDGLAEEGVVFERAFCTTPQCSPSRSSLYTGLYPHKTGVKNNLNAAGNEPLHHRTAGALLQQAGYHTGYFGKWHLDRNPIASAGWDVNDFRLQDNGVTRQGVRYLQQSQSNDGPFALFLNYLNPHDIYYYQPGQSDVHIDDVTLPQSWIEKAFEEKPPAQKQFMTENQGALLWGRPKEQWAGYRDYYRQKVRMVDQELGQVLTALKESGQWDDTIVVFTSDHGDMDTFHRLIFKGPFMYEHMVRVPFIVRVPPRFGGVAPYRNSDYDVVLTDVVPTLLDFSGAGRLPSDGQSLRPVLTGQGASNRRPYVISQYHGKQQWVEPIRMIRTADFKYNRYIGPGEELYDLRNDPDERVNLADDFGYREKKRELKEELDRWIDVNDDPFYSLRTTSMGEVNIHLHPENEQEK